MPALIALGSTLILRQGEQQREIPMEDIYLDYMKNSLREGEFVEAVRIPIDSEVVVAGYKLSKRFDQDISAVCGAFALRLDGDQVTDIRIAYGGMAAIPKRADETERCLIGQSWEENSIRAAMAALESDFQPLSDMRSSANYRGRAAANLLYRFYLQTRLQNPLPKAQLDVFEPRQVRL